jgi:pSer/pThr/pTyr-binding forkhead associated (FHA) protein/outer membrane biosynthesis protein TonB
MKGKFFLKPNKKEHSPILFEKEILTVGRSESCDICHNSNFVSFVHASLSVSKEGTINVNDLGSTNGTFINDEKIQQGELKEGDQIRFGDIRYTVTSLNTPKNDREVDPTAMIKDEHFIKDIREATQTNIAMLLNQGPEQVENLSVKDIYPQVEYSVFIVEDEVGENTFVYSKELSIEATSLYRNFVIDVDFFTEEKRTLFLSGKNTKENTIYCPYLTEADRKQIIKIDKNNTIAIEVDGFETTIQEGSKLIKDPFQFDKQYQISGSSLIIYRHKEYQLFLRMIEEPPKTKVPPFILFDQTLRNLNIIFILLWIAFSSLFLFSPKVDKPIRPQTEKIDRILFKKKEIEKKVDLLKLREESTNPSDQEKPVDQQIKQDRPEKTEDAKLQPKIQNEKKEKKGVVEKKTPKVIKEKPKTVNIPRKKVKPKPTVINSSVKKKPRKVKTKAEKKTAPIVDIQALQNRLANKLKAVDQFAKTSGNLPSNSKGVDTSVFKNKTGNAGQLANPDLNVRKYDTGLKGKASGSLAKGQKLAGGKNSKIKGFLDSTANIVTVGSLDPRDVQNVLKKYIPRFSFCYDQELERKNQKVATTLILNFTINSRGRAINRHFESSKVRLSPKVIRCFGNVLASIPFPIPKGGGVVGIRQPLNLEPRY